MESSVTEALEIVREMSVQKMINFNFIIYLHQIEFYIKDHRMIFS